ncbi:Mg2+ transporter protein CorA-like/Zinc transport protein ZntB [Penicillium angulare]|uniref:Mg2+ transporter protein CorA-like/Zinc transport protein ZntB n=1 Tax=Penicillium angulare TaxID=116970 RepID=A0A9W9EVE1_9EURO|nr:Mg2+ transporter protein CorA-like/Zinc transport protein ZntB [Penicillium angulare]
MADDQSDSRVREWLDQSGFELEARDAQDQPRNQNEDIGAAVDQSPYPDPGPRGSLDDILQLDPYAPEAIRLPESHSGSSATEEVISDQETERSFDVIDRFGTPPASRAARTALSEDLGTDQRRNDKKTRNKKTKRRLPFTYRDIIQNASKALKHIEKGNLQKDSRHEKTSIVYYDFFHDGSFESGNVEDIRDLPSLGSRSDDVRQRLIAVEDLSKRTIDGLGIRYRINPEFFEEHLLNSGYSGAHFNQPSSKTWSTSSLQKSYVCMKWFRPVWRTPTYFSNRDLTDLLKDKTEHLTRHGAFTTRAETNIFRSEWELWTNPAKTTRVNRECGWEEKISIWSGSLPNLDCQIVVILLDPLPQVSEQQRLFVDRAFHENDTNGHEERLHLISEASSDEGLENFLDILGRSEEDLPRRMNERGMSFWARYMIGDTTRKRVDKDPISRCIIEQMAPRREVKVDLDRIFQKEGSALEFSASLSETQATMDEFFDALEPGKGHISLSFPLLQIVCRDTSALLKQLRLILDEIDENIPDDAIMEERLPLWRQLISRAQRELPGLATSIRSFDSFIAKVDSDAIPEDHSEDGVDDRIDLESLLEAIERVTERLRVTSASLTSNMALLESRKSIDEAHAVARLTELAFIFIPLSFATSVFGMQIVPFANPVPTGYFFAVAAAATSFSYTLRLVMRSQWFEDMKTEMKADIRKYADKNGKSVQLRSLSSSLILQWGVSVLTLNIMKVGKFGMKVGKWNAKSIWRASYWFSKQLGFVVSFVLLVALIIAIPTGILGTQNLSASLQTAVSLGIVMITVIALVAMFSVSDIRLDGDDLWPRIFTMVPYAVRNRARPSGSSVLSV